LQSSENSDGRQDHDLGLLDVDGIDAGRLKVYLNHFFRKVAATKEDVSVAHEQEWVALIRAIQVEAKAEPFLLKPQATSESLFNLKEGAMEIQFAHGL